MKGLVDKVLTSWVSWFFRRIKDKPEEEALARCERLLRIIFIFVPRLHRTAVRNLEIAYPELTHREHLALARRSYRELARNLVWFAKLEDLSAEEVKALFDYSEAQPIFDRIRCHSVGTLFITGHFGLFELLAQAQTLHGRPYAILNRDFGLPLLDKYWRERREKFGSEMFGRRGGFQEMVKRLSSGQDVAVLFDQNVKRKHAEFVDLLGMKAATTKAVGIAALRTGCSVVFAVCVMNPPERQHLGRFRIHAREIPNPREESGSPEEQVAKFLRHLNQELEHVIKKWPEGWFWIHRRWKTRPPGEPENIYT